jgi:hypothetical protein
MRSARDQRSDPSARVVPTCAIVQLVTLSLEKPTGSLNRQKRLDAANRAEPRLLEDHHTNMFEGSVDPH